MPRVLFVFLILFVSSEAIALVPVIDMKSILGTIKNIEAIGKMQRSAHDNMERLRGDFNALNPLGFKSDNLSERAWSTGSWKTALSGGGSSMVENGIRHFKEDNKGIYSFSGQSQQKDEAEQVLQANAVLDAESTGEYDRLDSYAQKINSLSNLIASSASMKSALDINNKLMVELAYLEIEKLRMQTIANKANSQRMRHGLKLAADTDKYLGSIEGSP